MVVFSFVSGLLHQGLRQRQHWVFKIVSLSFLLMCLLGGVWQAQALAMAKVGSPKSPPTVGALIGGHPFVLEVANTPETLQKGLMGRRNLKANAGMLFQFPDAPQFRYFWMKGCLIPLDILFLNDGRIVHIEHLAQPCLPEVAQKNACPIITTRHNVDTVIEIAGGRARALGLQSGDALQWLAPSGQLPSLSR